MMESGMIHKHLRRVAHRFRTAVQATNHRRRIMRNPSADHATDFTKPNKKIWWLACLGSEEEAKAGS